MRLEIIFILIGSHYIGCLIESIREPLHHLSLKDYSYKNGSLHGSKHEIDILLFQQNSLSFAKFICKSIVPNSKPFLSESLSRCATRLSQTIRNAKVSEVEILLHEIDSEYKKLEDGTLINLSTVYEDIHNDSNICIFGEVSMFKLLFLLLSSPNRRLLLFLSPRLELNLNSYNALMPTINALEGNIATVVGDYVEVLKMISNGKRLCDIMHIIGGEYQDVIRLIHTNHGLHAHDTPSNHSKRVIQSNSNDVKGMEGDMWVAPLLIWEQQITIDETGLIQNPIHSNNLLKLSSMIRDQGVSIDINWHATGTWSKYSAFQMQSDSQGATSRSFMFVDQPIYQSQLTKVSIGSIECIGEPEPSHLREDNLGIYILITYTSRLLADNAYGLLRAIQALGYDVEVIEECTLSNIIELKQRIHFPVVNILQIAVGPTDPTLLLPNYIVYQMEQPWSLFFQDYQSYQTTLRHAKAIFVMSNHHQRYLQSKSYPQVHLIPLYSKLENPPPDVIPMDINGEMDKEVDTMPVGVLFFGGCSERRVHFLNDFIHQVGNVPDIIKMYRLNCVTSWSDILLDDERDYYVSISKVIINVHLEKESSLEVHRINYLLSMGKCVVSERSLSDPDLDSEYEEYIHFVDNIEDIFNEVMKLLQDHRRRRSMELAALERSQIIQSNTTLLTATLSEIISLV